MFRTRDTDFFAKGMIGSRAKTMANWEIMDTVVVDGG